MKGSAFFLFHKLILMQLSINKMNPLTVGTKTELPFIHPAILTAALWSILTKMFPPKTNQDSTANKEQHLDKLIVRVIDFNDSLRIEDMLKLEPKNNLNLIVFKIKVN